MHDVSYMVVVVQSSTLFGVKLYEKMAELRKADEAVTPVNPRIYLIRSECISMLSCRAVVECTTTAPTFTS